MILYSIIVALEERKEFTVGRSPENDIFLNSRNISKSHMRIIYRDYTWYMMDGTENKSSVNGTWISLNNKMSRFEKRFSDPMELRDNDQLKISENLISINFCNFN